MRWETAHLRLIAVAVPAHFVVVVLSLSGLP